MFVGFIVSLALCILSNCETSKRQREGVKVFTRNETTAASITYFEKPWVFLHVCTVKKKLLLCPALWITCRRRKIGYGDATGSTEDHQTMCAFDGQFTTALRVVQRTGSCLSLVLFVAMNSAGEGSVFYF